MSYANAMQIAANNNAAIGHDPSSGEATFTYAGRTVFFQDPLTHAWHRLRWTGLAPEGEVPSFGDARVRDLLRAARQAGLQPRSDRELLPLLLELIGAHTPIDRWPTLMTKAQRIEHAREVAQADAAAHDQPGASRPSAEVVQEGDVVPLRWEERKKRTEEAIDIQRRQRRKEAAPQRQAPPPLLGEAFRHRSLFLLPDDDHEDGHEDDGDVRESAP